MSYYIIIIICSHQGSKGIRHWPINRCTSPMMIHKITPSVDLKKWLKRLDTQLNNKNLIEFPNVIKWTNLKTIRDDIFPEVQIHVFNGAGQWIRRTMNFSTNLPETSLKNNIFFSKNTLFVFVIIWTYTNRTAFVFSALKSWDCWLQIRGGLAFLREI